MRAPEQTKVLVLGAGIGGLTAAVALRRAGFEVEIHERATELRPAGSGIAMLWNSLRALRSLDLGLESRLAELGGSATAFRFATPQGRTIRSMPPEAIVAEDGLRTLTMHRADVQQVLLEALDRPVQLGRAATGFTATPDGVSVSFADGTQAHGDVLVAADGIHSVVRAQLHGAEPVRPGGFVCWLATVPFEHEAVGRGYSTHYWGRGMRFGLHEIGGGRFYWWGTKTTKAPWTGTIADVREAFSDWAPECVAAIDATPAADLITVPAQDRKPLAAPWGEGRVTLLGDAAHPMLPSLGQGANQAIEDAVVLARELATSSDHVAALRRYELKRAPRVKGIVNGSRSLGAVEQTRNPLAVAVRDRYFRHVPERALINAMVKPAQLPALAPATTLPRALSPLERWHWILGSLSPLLSVARVRVEGRLTVEQLRPALAALQQRHPLLGAVVQTNARGRRPEFARGPAHPIALRTVTARADDQWQLELAAELQQKAVDFSAGPLARAVLVTDQAGQVHDLLLAVPCLLADNDGVLALQREWLALAAQQAGDVSPGWAPADGVVVPGVEELFPRSAQGIRGAMRTGRAALGDQVATARRKPARVVAEESLAASARRSGLVTGTVGRQETVALLSQARERGLHPRSVVAAALARALAQTAEPAADADQSPVGIGIMNPVREALAPDSTIPPGALGSYQALVGWIAPTGRPAGLWTLARDAQDRCDGVRARGDDLAGLGLLRALCPPSPDGAGKLAATLDRQGPGNVCLSYVESPFADALGGWRISGAQATLTTSVSSMITASATCSPGGLALSLAYVEGAVPRSRAVQIVELMVEALGGVAEPARALNLAVVG